MGFRTDLRAGCKTVLDAYKLANPTLLAHVYDHRPTRYLTPCAFVDNVILEPTIRHDSGTRQRVLDARVYVVNKFVSNDQTADEQDALVDGLVDAFTSNHSAVSGSLIEPISVDGEEVEDGDATYAASVITVRGLIQQGRT
jgi:hypothetical protein